MLIRTILLFSLFFVAINLSAADKKKNGDMFNGKLDEMIKLDGSVWNISDDDFVNNKTNMFFKWNSDAKDSARAPAYPDTPAMKFLGFRVYECIFRFANHKADNVYISLYNRGDAEDINSGTVFFKMIEDYSLAIEKWTGVKTAAAVREKVAKANVFSRTWKKDDMLFSLKWSYSGKMSKSGKSSDDFRVEYIKLDIDNAASPSAASEKNGADDSKKEDSAKNAKAGKARVKNESGDIYITDIPMVDQGAKGYCAVAVAERVLRYYGEDIDQHQIAQKAGTEEGTSPSGFEKALKNMGRSLGFKYKCFYQSEISEIFEAGSKGNLKCIQKTMDLVKQYNRYYKKAGCPKIDRNKYITSTSTGDYYDIVGMLNAMKPEGLKMLKLEGYKTDYAKFLKTIRENINVGCPILWAVELGLIQEEKLNPQARGGHMRLIIGYNDKDKKIIYSDTWGAEHTFKKMSMDDAWLMTMSAYTLVPRGK